MPRTTIVDQRRTFEEFLVEQGYLTKAQLAEIHLVAAKNRRPLEQVLVEQRILDEEKMTRVKAEFFGLPYVDLRNQNLPKEAMEAVSKDSIENYQFVPFAKQKNILKIALTDPTDLRALEALEFLAQKNRLRVELYLASPTSYQEALRKSLSITTEVSEALASIKKTEEKAAPLKAEPVAVARKITTEAPIAKIVDMIIKYAIAARASDIHIEPQESDLRIRYRIDGILHSSLIIPKVVHPAIVSRIKILSNLKIDEQRLPQDGRFHMDIESHSIDFRVSTLPTVNGEKVVLRILDKSGGVPKLEELGLLGMKLERLKENISKAHGMLLVTGPTGSGKSTTLYAVLNILNKVGVNIVTLEDPVEYFINGVNQSQINPEIGLTFASGLRSILRQDPNIIMVGEIRDKETAELAVHSALTGHLVFSTLHTNDAIGAIPRLLDMGIEAFLLTASLNAVMAQRLVRKICTDCKQEIEVPEEAQKMIVEELRDIPKAEGIGVNLQEIKFHTGKGCKLCGDSGYRGRIAIFEVMPLSDEIKNLILERESVARLREQARKEGMISMKQDGLLKVLKGVTTIEEVIRVTKE
ncbi:MAG: type II/IV secretion system protein [Candidatus Doudnabacteria bacterium]|nr:type II/IV secretion system protein [Candidatus Doudnabacteria bacterium]